MAASMTIVTRHRWAQLAHFDRDMKVRQTVYLRGYAGATVAGESVAHEAVRWASRASRLGSRHLTDRVLDRIGAGRARAELDGQRVGVDTWKRAPILGLLVP